MVCRPAANRAVQPPLPPLPASADDLLGFSTLPPVKVAATPAVLSLSGAEEPQQFPGFSQQLCDAYGLDGLPAPVFGVTAGSGTLSA